SRQARDVKRRAGETAEGCDCGRAAELSPRARADQAGGLADRGLRRSRTRSAGRSRRGRGGGARSQKDPEGHRRFQATDRRAPRGTVRANLHDGRVRRRLCLAFADRSRQYPARLAVGAGARGRCAAGTAETCVRRWPRPAGDAVRLRCRDRRRRSGALDRGSLDHRQGLARSPDVRARSGLPGLRLRAAQGLRRAGASGGPAPAWTIGASSPLFCSGRRRARKTRRHADRRRGRRDRHQLPLRLARSIRRSRSNGAGPRRLGHVGRSMRFTSLIIELIRARPRLVVWIVVLCQAALWLLLPMLLYRSPPGDLATVLAYGREYQVGTNLGPPLAFWLADIAFRVAGNHMFGVYLLAQLCSIATFWSLYLLARAVVGGQQAVLAVLLTMTIAAFSSPGVEFGPLVLARPLWALLLLHSWRLIGQHRRNAWFAWSIEAGLLLLTTSAALGLLLLIVAFALATARR